MPIYEYECEKCGSIEEVIQKISDGALTTCRSCNGSLHRLVSRSSFHLKGSGWYVTDYAKKSASSADTGSLQKETSKDAGSGSGSVSKTAESSAQ